MRSLLYASALTLPMLSIVPCAVAQDDTDPLMEPVIIVTAPGGAREADELIGAASRLDREDLIEQLSTTLGDTLEFEPGVSTTFFGQGASRPVLRGLGAERVQVLVNGQGVIDASAASPDHQVAGDGLDAASVEILRGPAALAYGGQAIGGVVNVIDGLIVEELPETAFGGEALAGYNSVNEGTEFAGRATFATGPFVLNLSASQRDFGDYDIPGFAESALQRAMEEAEHGDEDHDEHDHEDEEEARDTLGNSFVETQTLAAGLSYVGEKSFFGVSVRQQTSEYGLPGHAHENGEEEEENPFIDLEQMRIDLRGGVELDGEFLTGITGAVSIADYEHTEFEAPGEAGTVYESDGWEGRLDFLTQLGGYEGVIGVQYVDKSLDAFGEEAFISPTDTQNFGLYVYQAREFDSGVGIEGGLRAETVTRDNVNFGEVEFDLLSGSFGVHQHFDSGFFMGAQISYTERAPNESELFADGPHLATNQFEVGDVSLSKESGLNLEGTLRWTSDTYSVGMNLFVTDFSDFILLEPGQTMGDGELVSEADGLPVFAFVQDDAQFSGGEIYGDLVFEDGLFGADWEWGASLDFVDADLDGGGKVPFLPPVTINTSLSAEWGAFELSGRITHAGDLDEPGSGQLVTDDYLRVDLRAEVDLSDFGLGADGTELFVEARNVTDEEIRYSTSVLKDLVPASGRNIRGGVRFVF